MEKEEEEYKQEGGFYCCTQCSRKYKAIGPFKSHLARHPPLQPQEAQATADNELEAPEVEGDSNESTASEKPVGSMFQCNLCAKKYRNQERLDLHLVLQKKLTARRTPRKALPAVPTIPSDEVQPEKEEPQSSESAKDDQGEQDENEKEGTDVPAGGMFQCNLCTRKYRNQERLDLHLANHPPVVEKPQKLTARRTNRKEKEAAIPEATEQQPAVVPPGGFFQCHLCTKKYRSQDRLDLHLVNHPPVKTKEPRVKAQGRGSLKGKNQATTQNQTVTQQQEESGEKEEVPQQETLEEKNTINMDIEMEDKDGNDVVENNKEEKIDDDKEKEAVEDEKETATTGAVGGMFQCNLCTKKYRNQERLDLHLANHPPVKEKKQKQLTARRTIRKGTDSLSNSNSSIANSEGEKEPEATSTQQLAVVPPGGFFQCHLCTKKYRSQDRLDIHLANHPPVVTKEPVKARVKAQGRGSLKRKEMSDSTTTTTQEDESGEKEEPQPQQQQEANFQKVGNVFQCSLCPKKYRDQERMEAHVATHLAKSEAVNKRNVRNSTNGTEGKKEVYQCHLCNKKYRDKERMDLHLANHPPPGKEKPPPRQTAKRRGKGETVEVSVSYQFTADLLKASKQLLNFLLEISTPPLCDILANSEVIKCAKQKHSKWKQLVQMQYKQDPSVLLKMEATIEIKFIEYLQLVLSPLYYYHANKEMLTNTEFWNQHAGFFPIEKSEDMVKGLGVTNEVWDKHFGEKFMVANSSDSYISLCIEELTLRGTVPWSCKEEELNSDSYEQISASDTNDAIDWLAGFYDFVNAKPLADLIRLDQSRDIEAMQEEEEEENPEEVFLQGCVNIFSNTFLRHELSTYQKFLALCAKLPDQQFVSTPSIDLVWLAHMTCPHSFVPDIQKVLGKVIRPSSFIASSFDGRVRQSETQAVWAKEYKEVLDAFRFRLVYCPFDNLPSEIWDEIFTYLDVKALTRTCRVSKTWASVSNSNRLWGHFCQKHFPNETAEAAAKKGGENRSMKAAYKRFYLKKKKPAGKRRK